MKSLRLIRQIHETFGEENIEDRVFMAVAQSGPMISPESRDFFLYFSSLVPDFFERVNESYLQFESKLEIASRNIEVSSEELFQANTHLTEFNQTLDALLNSLGQAILIFDRNGVCSSIYSHKCLDILECDPSRLHVQDVLRIPPKEHKFFNTWIEQIFEERIAFDQLAQLGPNVFEHSQGRRIELEYKSVRNELGQVVNVVVIASDKTVEYESIQNFKKMRSYVNRVTQFLKRRQETLDEFAQIRRLAQKMTELAEEFTPNKREEALRQLHTAKSLCGHMNINELQTYIHEKEEELRFVSADAFIEKYIVTVDHMVSTVKQVEAEIQELNSNIGDDNPSIGQDKLRNFLEEVKCKENWKSAEIINLFADNFVLERVSNRLKLYQESCESLAAEYGKKVGKISFVGDFKISVPYWQDVLSNLSHIFTNIVVHGIEAPDERKVRCKTEEGQIRVFANETAEEYILEIEDDGGGIDPELIFRKYMGNSHQSHNTELSQKEKLQLVFCDGVTTQVFADTNAGRGVGLSALKAAVENIGGTIEVESEKYFWTRFKIVVKKSGSKTLT